MVPKNIGGNFLIVFFVWYFYYRMPHEQNLEHSNVIDGPYPAHFAHRGVHKIMMCYNLVVTFMTPLYNDIYILHNDILT